ncbi:GNAT family N-acetyltransferase [Palleronia sp. LCG004]|uniref:GNAT family N-acetyltransferase n=1 Tax=Palleronia sp. LCG004 TaxID=3079304 RepID=UPI002943351A|nr:GNAT family N-acetyltransferase [Palleronia sp. LCG004]WOI55235.1 GNAT family N-acetyltransferase [Palleronia sp. LCG004]
MIEEGYHPVPQGMLAAVVTHLVCERPIDPRPTPPGLRLVRETRMPAATYRDLYRLIGRDWLWTSRLMLGDEDLTSIIFDPDVELYVLDSDNGRLGMVELDFRDHANPQIAFFGLAPNAIGRGIGPWLMATVQRMMADQGAERIRLNTCTLDAPQALRFYLRHGFRAERREVQIFPDPRVVGVIDTDAAPAVPLL